jgi:hypothetical protein
MAAEGVIDSPGPKPVMHERGVSWDQTVTDNARIPFSPPTPGMAPEQPDLSGPQSFMAKTAAKPGTLPPRPPAISRRGTSGNNSSNGYSRRNMDLDSIADSRYEREAEDLILQTIEDQDPMHARSNTGEHILPGVPLDEIQHNFSVDSDEGKNSSAPATTPPRPTLNRPRLMSNDTSRVSRASQRLKLPQQTQEKPLTVEETLFGLTAALSAVHADEVSQGVVPKDKGYHERMDTSNSTDRLAKTAELVFGKRFMRNRSSVSSEAAASTSGDDSPPSPSAQGTPSAPSSTNTVGTGAKSKWGILKASIGSIDEYKKTDIAEEQGEDLEGIDIDAGGEDEGDEEEAVHLSTDEEAGSGEEDKKKPQKRRTRISKALGPFKHLPYAAKIKNEWDIFNNFLNPRKATMSTYARYIILYLWIPSAAAACILWYFFDNAPTGKGPFATGSAAAINSTAVDTHPVAKIQQKASISWWIIFIAFREVGILIMSKCVEAVIVDFLAIQTRAILRSLGPVITLLLVQSKGWPFLLSCWGVLNFLLVAGDKHFNRHWLFFQHFWGLLNENNPSGDVTNTLWFKRICAIASSVGAAVAAKRVAVGIYLGRQTFCELYLGVQFGPWSQFLTSC